MRLTAPEFKHLSNKHKEGLGKDIFLSIALISVVREIAVILSLILRETVNFFSELYLKIKNNSEAAWNSTIILHNGSKLYFLVKG